MEFREALEILANRRTCNDCGQHALGHDASEFPTGQIINMGEEEPPRPPIQLPSLDRDPAFNLSNLNSLTPQQLVSNIIHLQEERVRTYSIFNQ